jgi:asparagine synthase (glutamine-hydrolysing)
MCGIVGILGKDQENKDSIVSEMAKIIEHRGPDQDGFFSDDYVGLGMRRLSIIDISHGKQPISSADENLLIFFNGEIYNYKKLRVELINKGYTFKTESDTEVILHLYEAYGKSGISKLRGMFAFCIYDKTSHTVFIARDYFGIKPLYYLKSGRNILGFGSEIKTLLAHPKYKKEVNDDAVFNYLRFQYNPLEETFFKNIFTLKPGHCMSVDLSTNQFEIHKYWNYEFKTNQNLKEEPAEKKVLDVMRDSVKHHMIADVPVGSFLSGGVDSSIIATLANEIRNKENEKRERKEKLKTFTVGFKELSEGAEARETSDMLGTDHTEIIIDKEEYFSVLPKLVWHFDEPVADPSAIALYFVAREARKKVTVVLSGEGADELFGGYNIYRAPIDAKKLSFIPSQLLNVIIKILPDIWGKNYLRRASSKLSDWYIGNASIFTKEEQERLWKTKCQGPSLTPLDSVYRQAEESKISDSATMQLVDINTWMVGDILAKADKMTMANSLELRVPFLDIEVANLSRTLPDDLKWKDGKTKYILRQAFANIIPETARNRRKLGFPTPLRAWLTKDSTDVYETIRNSAFLKSKLNMSEVEKVISDQIKENPKTFGSGKKDNSRKIYLLYILALWHQVFFEDE